MSAAAFPEAYERALRSQRWDEVAPLIDAAATVTFSDGTMHRGREAVQAAFERNFAAISSEDYRTFDIVWVELTPERACYTFRFAWRGLVSGQPASGAGRGTVRLVRRDGGWRLLEEHLQR